MFEKGVDWLMSDFVSVIVPAFNVEKYIRETINSVIQQNYVDFEIIVIDDGSNDKTAEVVNAIKDKRIRYYFQTNTGLPARARNVGVGHARGEYLAFLDHDDLWKPDKLLKQIEILKYNNSIALIATNAFFMFEDKKTNTPFIVKMKSGYFKDSNLFPDNKVIQSTTLVKRKSFEAVGGLNEDPDLMAIEDYDLWLRLYNKYPCYYIKECLAYYRVLPNSASAGRTKRINRELTHYNKYLNSYPFPDKLKQKRLSDILFRLAEEQIVIGDIRWRLNIKKSFLVRKTFWGLIAYMFSFIPLIIALGFYFLAKKIRSLIHIVSSGYMFRI